MSKEGGGVQAQTVGNDLPHLGAALSVARPAWGYEVDPLAMPDARKVLRKLGMVSKSKERNRRTTLAELDKLMTHSFEMQARRKARINMPKVIAFALFSTRRQEEITRICWDDLDESRQAVLVRDMKNPGQKIGNDVWCHLPDEAWAILQSMPKHDGVSRLFEMDWDIPRVSSVSGRRDWNSLRRYTHLRGRGDAYEGWGWLQSALNATTM